MKLVRYLVKISEKENLYTMVKHFIMPEASDLCNTMFGNDECSSKLEAIPSLDTIITRHTDEMASL